MHNKDKKLFAATAFRWLVFAVSGQSPAVRHFSPHVGTDERNHGAPTANCDANPRLE